MHANVQTVGTKRGIISFFPFISRFYRGLMSNLKFGVKQYYSDCRIIIVLKYYFSGYQEYSYVPELQMEERILVKGTLEVP